MPVGVKTSPAKFLGVVSLGLGVIKGATSIIGGIQEKNRLREENERGKSQYRDIRDSVKNLEITNPYKDLNTSFENTYEDMTVNQQQAQFQAQQGRQARANLLQNLQGAAGASGIAGLAQAMANQQQSQTAQISANIGQQESRNQIYSAQGAANVQQMEAQAEQTVARGEGMRQISENERQMNLLALKMGQQQGQEDFRANMQSQNQAMMGGIGDIVGAGLQGFASGGGFSKDGFKMDTFLGRESGIGFDAAGDGIIGANESFVSNDFNTQHLSPNYDAVSGGGGGAVNSGGGGVNGPNARQNYIDRRKREIANSTKVSLGNYNTVLGRVKSSLSPSQNLVVQQQRAWDEQEEEYQDKLNKGIIR